MSDSFMHKHQSALDSQIEKNETEWLFSESVEDKDYPHEEEDFQDYEPTDLEMMSMFGTKWHDGL